EGLKGRLDAGLAEYDGSIFVVLVEVGVENALIHHVFLTIDLKDRPSQVMRLKHLEEVRVLCDSFLDNFGVVVEVLFHTRNDFRDDAETVTGWSLRVDGTIFALRQLRHVAG